MNFCNYVKTLSARASRDTSSNEWWEKQNSTSGLSETEKDLAMPKYDVLLTMNRRHEIYNKYIKGYPKLNLSIVEFKKNVPRLQNALKENKNWLNGNRSGEKDQYFKHFNIQSWFNLAPSTKKQHRLTNCEACQQHDGPFHDLLKSNPQSTLFTQCRKLMNEISPQNSSSTAKKSDAYSAATYLVNMVQPKFKEQYQMDLSQALTNVPQLNLTKKVSAKDAKKEHTNKTRQQIKEIENATKECDADILNFLAFGKSYAQKKGSGPILKTEM